MAELALLFNIFDKNEITVIFENYKRVGPFSPLRSGERLEAMKGCGRPGRGRMIVKHNLPPLFCLFLLNRAMENLNQMLSIAFQELSVGGWLEEGGAACWGQFL